VSWRKWFFAGVAIVVVVFECGYFSYARHSVSRARKLENKLEGVRFGMSSQEVEALFQGAGLSLKREDCSPSCLGLAAAVQNFPAFDISERVAVDNLLSEASLVRPASFYVDFHFYQDKLRIISLVLSSPGAGVSLSRHLVSDAPNFTSTWRTDPQSKKTIAICVGTSEEKTSPQAELARGFDLGCLGSLLGCRTAADLWPSAPQARSAPVDGGMILEDLYVAQVCRFD